MFQSFLFHSYQDPEAVVVQHLQFWLSKCIQFWFQLSDNKDSFIFSEVFLVCYMSGHKKYTDLHEQF